VCGTQSIPECSAGGRDISVELDAYWQRHVTERFAQPNATDCTGGVDRPQSSSGQRDLQNAAQEASSGCYWRTVYDIRVREHTEKQQRVRDKVQRMFHAEKAARQQRSAQVGLLCCCHGDCFQYNRGSLQQ
jgi:hypothetical protein